MARPIVSVIIASQNEAERVVASLEALAKQRTQIPFEVILVDHASGAEAFRGAAAVAKRHKNFSVLRERRPGCAWAYNLGARRARGSILLFTEVDCVPSKTWVEEMAKPLLTPQHYPLAAVGGHTKHEYDAGPNLVERYLNRLYTFWERDRQADFPTFLPWAPGINLAVKRDIFLGLGGFDTRWRNAGYDVDFCWRLALCGFVLGAAPKAEIRHVRRSNLRGLLRQVENSAFHNQFLLTTYGQLLRLPEAQMHAPRLLRRRQRTPRTSGYVQKLRRFDPLSVAFGVHGEVQSRLLGVAPNPKLRPTRLGRTPAALEGQIPPGYKFLH